MSENYFKLFEVLNDNNHFSNKVSRYKLDNLFNGNLPSLIFNVSIKMIFIASRKKINSVFFQQN